ncbi:MAG: hypothetical protein MZU95_13850 [Desulfomicrobium escambiense]|nr:hypothetical protein [Desulfomicrobium escambiense]
MVAMAEFRFPCTSPFLIESKSLKLYLNSFNQTRFADSAAVAAALERDLAAASGAPVGVRLLPLDGFGGAVIAELPGHCLDDLDVSHRPLRLRPGTAGRRRLPAMTVEETLHSHLLKSNCLVTRQPDWASVLIRYRGPRIDPAALLRYLVSYPPAQRVPRAVRRADLHRPAAPLPARNSSPSTPATPAAAASTSTPSAAISSSALPTGGW